MISVVGTGLSLPFDGEPYGPGDSEYSAGQRLLQRVIEGLGKRLAQYVVVIWDAEDFDPWDTLDWETVRVFFYRQHKPDGTVVEAYWLTNFASATVGPASLFRMAESRWEIENQGFNEAKSRHGLEHICHHHANRLLIGWLLAMLALTIERLYRLRYLRRGTHPLRSSAELLLVLWVNLFRPCPANTS